MLDTPLSSMLWLSFIFGATSGLMAIGQWTPMMAEVLDGQTFAPDWMGSFGRFVEPVGVLAIFNALGRIFWGRVSDIIDRPRAMMIMFLFQGMAFMLLVSAQTPLTIFLASAWVGLNFGGNFALFPAATSDYFGARHLGVNYGWIFTAYGVAGIMGPGRRRCAVRCHGRLRARLRLRGHALLPCSRVLGRRVGPRASGDGTKPSLSADTSEPGGRQDPAAARSPRPTSSP